MPEQRTHWRKIIESEYLGGADLDDGQGNHKPIVATIQQAKKEDVLEPGTSRKEQCLVISFREKIKPMIVNVTNSRAISKVAKSEYIEDWAGVRIKIGTERVKAFGELWDALRVSTVAPQAAAPAQPQAPTACTDCNQAIGDHEGVAGARIANITQQKYGRALCFDCSQKVKEALESGQAGEGSANAAE
jgi:hypothetical protein